MLVVFDLDGTLIESSVDIANSVSELVTSLGGRRLDLAEVTPMIGDGAGVLVQRALEAGGLDPQTPDALPRFLDIYRRRLLEHTRPYPGAKETLASLSHRAQLAILTNKPLEHSERVLEGLGLREFFATVVGGDGPLGKKPNPAALLALIGEAPARGVMMVGDSPIDADTAAAANCAFGWARYGFGVARFTRPPDTPYVLDRLSDLVAVVDRLDAVLSGR